MKNNKWPFQPKKTVLSCINCLYLVPPLFQVFSKSVSGDHRGHFSQSQLCRRWDQTEDWSVIVKLVRVHSQSNVCSSWYQSRWLIRSYHKADCSSGCFSGDADSGSRKSSWVARHQLESLNHHWIFSLSLTLTCIFTNRLIVFVLLSLYFTFCSLMFISSYVVQHNARS